MTTTTPTKGRLALFHLRRHRHHVVVNPRQIADVLHVYATQAKLHHCFGKDEVMRLCEQFSMDYSRMEQWYDGYLLGQERVHVYNPNSVACAIEERQFHSYWTETETYEAL